jgi:hypothetical protein
MTDQEFVKAFETCRLPNESFHHRDHLRLAWIYLRTYGRDASARIGASIRRYAAFHGKSDKYHETVTVAWMLLLAEQAASAPEASFEQILTQRPELLDKNTLHQYYSPELLASSAARLDFVAPDRKPLPDAELAALGAVH